MKQQVDMGRKEMEFLVGDKVFLNFRPYRQRSLVINNSPKLAAHYYGPYTILEKIGSVAYRLELPPNATIHPVFHVSQLRRAVGNCASSPHFPSPLSEDLELQAIPEDILDVRQLVSGQPGQLEVLVKWQNLSMFEASWENWEALLKQFPDCHLEDKVDVQRGSIAVPPVRFTYTRRRRT